MKHAPIGLATNEKQLQQYFETGHIFCLYGKEHADFQADAKRLWAKFRDEFLQTWIAEHPGTRPWAWWQWDAPERRHRIGSWNNGRFVPDKKPHPFENPAREKIIAQDLADGDCHPDYLEDAYRLTFGVPAIFFGEIMDDWVAAYEDEADYLARLGLLLPGEQPK